MDMNVKIMLGAQSAYACIKTSTVNLDVRLNPGRSAKTSLNESASEMREKAVRSMGDEEMKTVLTAYAETHNIIEEARK